MTTRLDRERFPWLPLVVLLSSGLLLVNGGHLGGTDSEAQMIAALALARTGSPSVAAPCGETPETDVQ